MPDQRQGPRRQHDQPLPQVTPPPPGRPRRRPVLRRPLRSRSAPAQPPARYARRLAQVSAITIPMAPWCRRRGPDEPLPPRTRAFPRCPPLCSAAAAKRSAPVALDRLEPKTGRSTIEPNHGLPEPRAAPASEDRRHRSPTRCRPPERPPRRCNASSARTAIACRCHQLRCRATQCTHATDARADRPAIDAPRWTTSREARSAALRPWHECPRPRCPSAARATDLPATKPPSKRSCGPGE